MEYNHKEIEAKWQKIWAEEATFKAEVGSSLPKYYVLDMFPYPSGAGLHVGHPLGYIASDIYSRYKRHKGFNVLHPMGYDSFGLPAEQYAIQTGQHPRTTTEKNIARYREQLDKIGFSFDWSREVRTTNPDYYRWTQWIFKQFFNAWYNTSADKAENIETLIAYFKTHGTTNLTAAFTEELNFTAEEWNAFDDAQQSEVLLNYRLAYRSESMVNWCPELGTVLANDEVKDGVSERGGFPVIQKKMMQWSMRISAYAQRLLDGLETIDWSTALKESQRNWIGRSEGASLEFKIQNSESKIEVFTTRPDTIFGVSFMTLAPEHEYVDQITTEEYKDAIKAYKIKAAKRSERDRMADVKTISGQFTGAYAEHPFNGELIPIWIGDYVLASYGTGAVMAVPGHDSRDWAFAMHFGLEIKEVVAGGDISKEAFEAKEGTIINSDFINGLSVKEAGNAISAKAKEMGIGEAKINYRLRDAIFGRQRYWGEPIPVYYENDIPKLIADKDLPLNLPDVDKYLPTEDGEPPLARATDFTYNGFPIETTTMPGWAGSSWYFLRYMDAHNESEFVSKETMEYWGNVDLYIGGSEHATGHLLYARFWHKFLADMCLVNTQEPFQKLINQGMIQGVSAFVYRVKGKNKFVSKGLKNEYDTAAIHADLSHVDGDHLNVEAFKNWRAEFKDAEFVLEDGKYIVGHEVEKMSKSKYNVVNPDDVITQYGADALRMYEMFLGPLEQSKPWSTQGLSGVNGFFKKFWRLFQNGISDEKATAAELKALHTCIKKVNEDIENFSFNTSVAAFMICANELNDLKCKKRPVLEPLAVLISPFAPHMAEELWSILEHTEGISRAAFPTHEQKFLVESSKNYPVSFNGKMRFTIDLPLDLKKEEIEKAVMAHEKTAGYIEGKTIRKVIIVPGKIINIVVG
jgi:leucyl-tRNA synthetase